MAKSLRVCVWVARDISFDFGKGTKLDCINVVGLGYPWMVRNGCKHTHELRYTLVAHAGNTDFSERCAKPELLCETPFSCLTICLAWIQIPGYRRTPFTGVTLPRMSEPLEEQTSVVIEHQDMHGTEVGFDPENIGTRNETDGAIHVVHAVDQRRRPWPRHL
jgi:hypothetical protein